MSSIIDSCIFRDIFGSGPMRDIWSDKRRTEYYLEWEAALAIAQARLAIIPEEARDVIVEKCKIENMDFEKLKRDTELIGYPVLGVVQQIVALCPHELGGWCHFGATTQDVTDTATVMAIRASLDLIENQLDELMHHIANLAEKYREQPMVARSNMQQAVPITFGFKMARLLATLQRHRKRMAQIRERVLTLEFSGAAGTLASITDSLKATQCQEQLAQELDLRVPEIAWHTERDGIVETGTFLAMLCGTLSKCATDVKLMMQTEVGEVSEPFVPHRGSSSAMPNKVNPISCVYIHAIAATVRQHAAALMESMVQDHERSSGPWVIEWIVLPEIFILTAGALDQACHLMGGLVVHPEAMLRNLYLTNGLVVSEAVMIRLAPLLDRKRAHDLVYDCCRRASSEHKTLAEILKSDPQVTELISDQQIDQLCDPRHYLGLSCDMVDNVLKEYKRSSRKE
ncbi:L-Aspartase-like protein [Radiomyces spectabilis]|uniref:L-Aspartase-like protein n=1 Tax=Radiomyces spectabilis TaxID=64574 RepID=UPI0022205C7C|nr:L-Aspartase-like protein [Radiomyces spectabilis]KAI8370604.1 L-Aspartase-like protein [Radiomyces spectabilis]